MTRLRSTSSAKIRDVPDFPQPGIVFKDIMPLLADPEALREAVDTLAEWAEPREPDLVLGAEARGFILGGALAYAARLRLRRGTQARQAAVADRRARSTRSSTASDSLEVHADAIGTGARVLVHDDVLATGGTAEAKVELVEQLGGVVVGLAVRHRARVPRTAASASPATTSTR